MSRIVFELEADGFTHLACTCGSCNVTSAVTFAAMRARLPFLTLWSMTPEEIAARMVCETCPDGMMTLEPIRRAKFRRGGPGIVRDAPLPVRYPS